MIQSIKKSIVLVLLIAAFTSCNREPTLQTYFVDNELKPGFMSFDAPTSLINLEGVEMTDEQREAYDSVDKLNVLAYTLGEESNTEDYNAELDKVKIILKNSKYEELARGGNSTDGKFVVKFIGDIASIDELFVFGSSNYKGFLVVRILGDDMNAGKLMSLQSLLKDAKIEDSQLNSLTDFFK